MLDTVFITHDMCMACAACGVYMLCGVWYGVSMYGTNHAFGVCVCERERGWVNNVNNE